MGGELFRWKDAGCIQLVQITRINEEDDKDKYVWRCSASEF
jgi:hypothetical protein